MSIRIKPSFETYINGALALWLTTVRADGMPQPTPVWFAQDADGSFVIYAMPDSQKVKNIRHNPKVSLSFNIDAMSEQYIVIMGEAKVDESLPPSSENSAYQEKYRTAIPAINFTPTSLAATFSLPIRIIPSHIRGEIHTK
ncbi:MAG TPA: TIGR03667 family PPOX class F420-dependent oxidoreductase [Phototrophicaceae bacterium]|jgi:PPOX class probable F420-dependent enzyme|nr:TIGR03667 family PPOX class F420-dependent oxidoreductase [Phototrophicaceae bacterium]